MATAAALWSRPEVVEPPTRGGNGDPDIDMTGATWSSIDTKKSASSWIERCTMSSGVNDIDWLSGSPGTSGLEVKSPSQGTQESAAPR